MSALIPDPVTQQLIDHLQRGGNCSYLWAYKDLERISIWWKRGEDVPPFLDAPYNMYFGVHPCTQIPPTNMKGQPKASTSVRSQLPYIAATNCLFAEYDAKHFGGSKEAAQLHIDSLDLAPSVIIDSGGGYHCYWLFIEPFMLKTDEQRARADHAQKGWVKLVGSDDGAKDLVRVLRVPGTQNFKPEYGPDFPVVHFVHANFDQLYTFDELESLIPAEQGRSARSSSKKVAPQATPAATVDQAVDFATIAEVALLFDRLSTTRRDSYTGWYQAGMAVRGMGHIGFYLWKKWSEKSPKSKSGDCEEKWPTFHVGVPGEELTLDSLRRWAHEDDPNGQTIAGDVVPRDEYERVKAERDELKQGNIWRQQIFQRPDLQPTEKGIIAQLAPIIAANRNLGSNNGRVPVSYKYVSDVLHMSPSTIARGIEAGERIGIWRRDPESALSRDGFEIKYMRLELQPAYDTPAVLPVVEMPKRGGARPNAGRKPKCPHCSPDFGVRRKKTTTIQDICVGCGTILYEETIIEKKDWNDETKINMQDAPLGGLLVESVEEAETQTKLLSWQEIKIETEDTTLSSVSTLDDIARTKDQLVPKVNADKVKFVEEQLPKRGADWAFEFMQSVESWEAWPPTIRRRVMDALAVQAKAS